ncbi:hypothetical protein AB4124_04850 [Paenibacillus sp. 2KB_20]|uniref:hypothetical protein n=1 Tax=Paenibacillus sp. 2KB_20 TaxID=3232977 RepID=UPI003F9890D0
MKAVPKVNTDGLYLEDTLVDDAFSGAVPFYAPVIPTLPTDPGEVELETAPEDEQPEDTPELEIAGFIVGIPVIPGLYRPRFDLAAWEAYQDTESSVKDAFKSEYDQWSALPEEERGEPPIYQAPMQPTLWIEGLTPEEIEELTRPQPQELNEVDRLGSEMVARELEAMELRQQNEAQGAQIVGLELRLLSLENS